MFSAWLVGLEDVPERSGEICLVEVFGATAVGGSGREAVARRSGPGCTPSATRRSTRTSWPCPRRSTCRRSTRTRIDWQPGRVTFFVDGTPTRVVRRGSRLPRSADPGRLRLPGRGPGSRSRPRAGGAAGHGPPLIERVFENCQWASVGSNHGDRGQRGGVGRRRARRLRGGVGWSGRGRRGWWARRSTTICELVGFLQRFERAGTARRWSTIGRSATRRPVGCRTR